MKDFKNRSDLVIFVENDKAVGWVRPRVEARRPVETLV